MRRWLVLPVLLLLAVALGACGGAADEGGPGDGAAATDAVGGADAAPGTGDGSPSGPDGAAGSPDGAAGAPDAPDALAPADAAADAAAAPPRLLSVEPARGPTDGGTLVMLTGAGFADDLEVWFGATPAVDVFVVDDRFATCATPPGGPGAADVRVRRAADGAEALLAGGFTYEDGLSVAAMVPGGGPSDGGTPFTVTGRGFPSDAVLAVGGRLALSVAVLDNRTIVGVTPPGAVGVADVTVVTHGDSAVLPDGFRYGDTLALERVDPPTGRTLGGEVVTLVGRGLDPLGALVTFGGAAADVVRAAPDGTALDVRTPPGAPGPVEVVVTLPDAAARLARGFTYTDPAYVAGVVAVHAVFPDSGPTDGGEEVTVVVTGIPAAAEPTVWFDDQPGTVLAFDAAHATLLAETPPHAAGRVRVSVRDGENEPGLDDAYRYEPPLSLRDVDPPSGPAAGGTPFRLRGRGFGAGAQVFIGALPVRDVSVHDDATLVGHTPPGSPGPADVRVVLPGPAGPREARLRGAFTYTSSAMALLAVEPHLGSQAGGTFVRFRGVGLPAEPAFTVGGQPAEGVVRVSDVEATGYTPRGDPGTVDVVLASPAGASTRLRDGYTYFDPTESRGGTWGAPIDGAVNVTVLESGTGFGLQGAYVILGSDPATPWQGFTDDRGQITFSGPDLYGPVEVNATKPGYAAYSVIEFDAENVTVWLQQVLPPQTGGGGGPIVTPPVGRVQGRVLNADKHLLIPPGDCADVTVAEPPLCLPCAGDRDCGEGHRCTTIGDTGRWCTRACGTGADCPTGYLCSAVGPGVSAQCVPRGGTPRIFCRQSDPSMYGGAPSPGPFAEVNQHHEFLLNTNPGELAVYCVAGVDHPLTYRFEPLVMGLVRHVFVPPNGIAEDLQVLLDIPLDRDLTLVFSQLPEHPAGTLAPSVRGGIDLGADGWLRLDAFNTQPQFEDGYRIARWAGQPKSLDGPLFDTSYTFYVTVTANTPTYSPYSAFYREGAVPSDDDRLLVRDPEGQWGAVDTGVQDDLNALWGTAPDDVWGVGARGRIYHLGPAGWTAQPVPSGPELNDLDGATPDDAWAVGDRGRLLRFNGVFWESWDSLPERPDLVSVAAAAPDAVFAATSRGGVLRFDGAQWQWLRPETGAPLHDVWAPAPNDAWFVGADGLALHWNGATLSGVYVPTTQALHAIHGRAPVDAFAVGTSGRIFRWDGQLWQPVPSPTERDLRDVRHLGPAEAIAVGDDGALLHWDGVNWLPEAEALNVRRHLKRLWLAPDDSVWALGPRGVVLGPFMGYAFFTNPLPGGVLDPYDREIRWRTAGEVVPSYNYLTLTDLTGYPFWTTILDGPVEAFALPPLEDLLGVATVPANAIRVTLTRALNPAFTIDGYQNRDLGTFRRSTWAVEWVDATAPPLPVP